ncbi:MAG: hypothetical protein MUO73_06205, partial [Thermoplasmata archaeon]|nr:hypothetical protein [Thermoplasmata archaeon]
IFFSFVLRDRPYIGATIFYGVVEGWGGVENYFPAQGNIWTDGLYGIKSWSGTFYGNLPTIGLVAIFFGYFSGVNGFTGLRLYLNQTDFYFGTALNVNVGPEHP